MYKIYLDRHGQRRLQGVKEIKLQIEITENCSKPIKRLRRRKDYVITVFSLKTKIIDR